MEILDEVLKFIPDKTKVSDTSFEGANIILYTKDKEFFLNSNGILKEIIQKKITSKIKMSHLYAT